MPTACKVQSHSDLRSVKNETFLTWHPIGMRQKHLLHNIQLKFKQLLNAEEIVEEIFFGHKSDNNPSPIFASELIHFQLGFLKGFSVGILEILTENPY